MEVRAQQHSRGLEALLEPGETNPRLENFLLNYRGNFSDGFLVPPLQDNRGCNLCGIAGDPEENIFELNSDYMVVEAATKKGHNSRNMVVTHDDRWFPSDRELEDYARDAMQDLVEETFRQYDGDGPVVVYSGMNTFTHPHIVASDLEVLEEEASKLEEVNNYLVFDDPGSLDDPLFENYGDTVGEAFLKRFYDAARK